MIIKCPFCDLENEKARTLKTGKLTSVILSNPRLMPGHILVVPKRHIEKPWELTNKEVLAIFEDIKWVEGILLASKLATGCDIRQNYRPFMKQGRIKVNHVHFHVLPRTIEDELFHASMKHETVLFKDLSDKERQSIQELFQG